MYRQNRYLTFIDVNDVYKTWTKKKIRSRLHDTPTRRWN